MKPCMRGYSRYRATYYLKTTGGKSSNKYKTSPFSEDVSVMFNMSAFSRGDKQSFNCKMSFKIHHFDSVRILYCPFVVILFLTRQRPHALLPMRSQKNNSSYKNGNGNVKCMDI